MFQIILLPSVQLTLLVGRQGGHLACKNTAVIRKSRLIKQQPKVVVVVAVIIVVVAVVVVTAVVV